MIQQVSPNHSSEIKQLRLLGLINDTTSFAASYEQEVNTPLRYYKKRILNSNSTDGFGYWGYYQSQKLIGYALLSHEKLFHSSHLAHVYELIIHPDYRGQGLGKELMAKLIDICKNHPQITQLHLKCSSLNVNAQKLYSSLGFNHYATRKNSLYYKNFGFVHQYMYCLEV